MDRTGKRGFTLIELMIVVAIIAAIAIPGLMRARISSNETSAIGALKSVSTAQHQFQQQGMVDQDADGAGEFGVFQELAGTVPCRGTGLVANPTFLPANSGTTAANGVLGEASASGYLLLMYLPNAIGAARNEAVVLGVGVVAGDAIVQENCWVCYAWPADRGTSGGRAFVVNQEGQVYQCANGANGSTGPW